jgi:hypothetical protein
LRRHDESGSNPTLVGITPEAYDHGIADHPGSLFSPVGSARRGAA